ncbi:tetratricopeptide repeat protein [Paenibacillus sp. LMG 31456]|uniref:Tetratricopeptide repeat protein n=1 Tax=Paenibacillus foliorum TaxID=2654974 RepID=A0A972GPA6_9BACL|nr:tetratricopeptide repeat protein [Paenibacillus foliorum]NOU91698.1 tetratricopeptide repeat protein [Paenibacillus foliorum]
MKTWIKLVLQLAVPVVILIILFKLGLWYGLAGVAVVAGIIIYWLRGNYYVLQANIRYGKKDLRGALDYYGRAYKANRNSGFAISQAFVLLKLGEIEQAEKLLSQIMQRKMSRNNEMTAKINYSIALWKLGKHAEAVAMLEEILPTFKNSIVYGNLGLYYLMMNDLDKALEFNLEAYEYTDSDKTILDNLGFNYYLLGRYSEAKEIYEKLMLLNPAFPEAYYYYALTLSELGDQASALKLMEQGLSYEPSMITTLTRDMIEEKLEEWRGIPLPE